VQSAREAALAEVRPLIENYLKSDLYRMVEQIVWKSSPGQVESEVEFVCRTRWMPVRGRIDKLVVTDDGEATIVDFKTDRKTAEQLQPLDEEYTLQLRIYALAMQQAIRPKSVRAELYFLDPNVRVPVSDDDLDGSRTAAILDELGEAIIRGRNIEDFPAKPEPSRCRRCSCVSFCPEKAR
jgi:RecB family exonuclease